MQNTESGMAYAREPRVASESSQSAVSWGAVIAGAVIGAALAATLIAGGAGLGLSAVSPWQAEGASGPVITVGTIIWLLVSQIIAYGIAGYVAGRLRTKWTDAAVDEIYFRDTAHGFLVWALSLVVGLVLLGSSAASLISGTAKAGAGLAQSGVGAVVASAGQAGDGQEGWSVDYFTDMLLRPEGQAPNADRGDIRRQVSVILGRSIMQGEMSDADQAYLASVISQQAGISEGQAQTRLNQVATQAREAVETIEMQAREVADEARKVAATFSLWAFASLLIGAFVASFAATIGGRARDT